MPCRRSWRVTTFCNGSVTWGVMLPMSVTVPPLRTESNGGLARSHCGQQLRGPGRRRAARERMTSRASSCPERQHIGLRRVMRPAPGAWCRRRRRETREHPAARAACSVSRPIMPAPITSAVSPPRSSIHAPHASPLRLPQAWRPRQRTARPAAGRRCGRGTETYSANAPLRRYSPQETPTTSRLSQRLMSPRRQ